jgi:hypothetical protein
MASECIPFFRAAGAVSAGNHSPQKRDREKREHQIEPGEIFQSVNTEQFIRNRTVPALLSAAGGGCSVFRAVHTVTLFPAGRDFNSVFKKSEKYIDNFPL